MQAAGYVLAGGRSTRMGRDKALLELDGEPLVARALASLAGICADVAIAGGDQRLGRFGRVVPDRTPGLGPLGGIVAALESSPCEWNLFVPVDVPFVPRPAWLRLMAAAETTSRQVVLARSHEGVQPLCGLYRRSALGALRGELLTGRGKVRSAVEDAGGAEYVDFPETEWFRNFNTPAEFQSLIG